MRLYSKIVQFLFCNLINNFINYSLSLGNDNNNQALSWAQIVNKNVNSNLKNKNFYESRMLDLNNRNHNVLSQEANNPVSSKGRHSIERGQPPFNIPGQPDSNKFQRRALDFIYHKFVEPKIHKHTEARPSLLEELVGTFESHVKKDLAAWNQGTPQTTNKREVQKNPNINTEDMEAHSSSTNVHIDPNFNGKDLISSVSNVVEGETDDTFIVTDDSGQTHVITVDEIINSLSQMNENEINNLLVGSPIEPDIERADIFPEHEEFTDRMDSFPPTVLKDIQYSRKGVDDDDIILIQSEDGDTRLVTVKDARISEENKKRDSKNKNKVSKSKSIQSISGNSDALNSFHENPISNSHITLEDIMRLYGQESDIHIPQSSILQHDKHVSPSQIHFQQSENNKKINNNPKFNANVERNKDNLDLEYLLELKKNKEKKEQFLASPSAVIPGVTAPNSPPLKVINTEASLMDLLPFQSSVSIRSNTPPVIQKTGIRKRLSNFFSRLVGKPVTDVNISNQPGEEHDEFVQIVMPRSDSNTMEQITIPLPKAIHHKGRNVHGQMSTPHKSKAKRAERRSSTAPEATNTKRSKSKSTKGKSEIKPTGNGAESLLYRAKIPDSIKEKIIAQINEKPDYLHPNFKEDANQQIDRSDGIFSIKNKADPKPIKFPIGYTYDIPSEFENYNPYPIEYGQPGPYPGGKGGKGKDKGVGDDQPLLDINLLADLVLLSKDGDENQSFSFPKIGDASQFVDVRRQTY